MSGIGAACSQPLVGTHPLSTLLLPGAGRCVAPLPNVPTSPHGLPHSCPPVPTLPLSSLACRDGAQHPKTELRASDLPAETLVNRAKAFPGGSPLVPCTQLGLMTQSHK